MNNPEQHEKDEFNVPNPFELWKKFYFAAEDALSTTVKDAISTQTYAQAIDTILNNYLVAHKMFSEANTKNLEHSPLPSKYDVARVAELVVSLEDKLDQIEGGLITQLIRVVQNISAMSDRISYINERTTNIDQQIAHINDRITHIEDGMTAQLQDVRVQPAAIHDQDLEQVVKHINDLDQRVKSMESTLKEISKSLKAMAKKADK